MKSLIDQQFPIVTFFARLKEVMKILLRSTNKGSKGALNRNLEELSSVSFFTQPRRKGSSSAKIQRYDENIYGFKMIFDAPKCSDRP